MPVTVGYAGRKVTLSPHPTPSSGWDTIVAFEAWQMSGEFPTHVGGLGRFCERLEQIHQSLDGHAEIAALDGDFALKLAATSRGGIEAQVSIVHAEGADEVRLSFQISIDQSYLPAIINSARAEFPMALQ